MKIYFTKRYFKQYRKLNGDDKIRVSEAIRRFVADPHDPSLKNHVLHGKLRNKRSISASNDLRLIFEVKGDYVTVIMLAVGSHNQVY